MSKIRKRFRFAVSLSTEEPLPEEILADYVADAVSSWCKQYNPGSKEEDFLDRDPLFDIHSVVVKGRTTGAKG